MRNFQANDLSHKSIPGMPSDKELKKRLPDWVKSADAKANWRTVKSETLADVKLPVDKGSPGGAWPLQTPTSANKVFEFSLRLAE